MAEDDAEVENAEAAMKGSDSSSSFGVRSEYDESDDDIEGHVGADVESESNSGGDNSLGSSTSSDDENDDLLKMWNPSARGILYVIF